MTTPGTAPAPAAPRRRRPSWVPALVVVAVLALLSPLAWVLTRPAPDAGLPLEQALAAPPSVAAEEPATVGPGTEASETDAPATATPGTATPSPAAPSTAAPSTAAPSAEAASPFGAVRVRDASVDAVAAVRDPAPARLRVDGLGIDAAVDAVGVEDDGSMVIPAEVARVGWYRFGATAGAARGHTVIAGHVDGAGDGPGALFPLRGVDVGTRVTVTDEAGDDHVYEVVGRESITKDVLPVDEIFAREGEHRLVLITCGGEFIPELGSYRENVVVTAVPVTTA